MFSFPTALSASVEIPGSCAGVKSAFIASSPYYNNPWSNIVVILTRYRQIAGLTPVKRGKSVALVVSDIQYQSPVVVRQTAKSVTSLPS